MTADPGWLTGRVVCSLLVCLAIPAAGRAQDPGIPASDGPEHLSEAARVSLVTVFPGEEVYSLFGHNAIRVVDPPQGIDVAYNYGTFSFGNPVAFAARFAYGDLNYRLDRQSFGRMAAYYPVAEGRPIVEQVLDLDPEAKEEIYRFLEWNALPENAYYRYDFYFDNCATRIRDVLERTLGDRLIPEEADPHATLRQLLDPYLAERSWLHFAMDTGQGIPADAPATWRSALFLPDRLATWAAGSRVAGPDGPRPLVASTDSIGWADSPTLPTGGLDWPALLMTALLVLVVGWTALDLRTGGTRRGAAWLDVPLLSALGFAGLLIGFLWFVALHAVTKNNLNLLWALPTNLVLVAVYGRQRGRPWKIALLAATAVCAFVFAVGWPVWPQELPLATLPLAVAVAVRMSGLVLLERRARAREGTARS